MRPGRYFFDVETRSGKTGDGVFLAVTKPLPSQSSSLVDVPSSFFTDRLFNPTGRFSFYGPPTDIKVKKSYLVDAGNKQYRYIEVTFSNLSQSTNAEIPRKALIVATVPTGTDQAIMLVGSANASRWKDSKGGGGVKDDIYRAAESFRAVPAPKTNLKIRPKQRGDSLLDL